MKAKVLSDNTRGTIHFISVITHARCDKSACFHYYAEQNTLARYTKRACCNVTPSLISDNFTNAKNDGNCKKIYSVLVSMQRI